MTIGTAPLTLTPLLGEVIDTTGARVLDAQNPGMPVVISAMRIRVGLRNIPAFGDNLKGLVTSLIRLMVVFDIEVLLIAIMRLQDLHKSLYGCFPFVAANYRTSGAATRRPETCDRGVPSCHGPWMLIEAEIVRGRMLTSWPSLKTDLRNAGATWVDREVVQDGNLTTSRKPDDLPDFIETMLNSFAPNHGTILKTLH